MRPVFLTLFTFSLMLHLAIGMLARAEAQDTRNPSLSPGPRSVVVELYTSQGCASCPPADRFLHELSRGDDVLPLALHVDYWDYLGWRDAFARPAFALRQAQYNQLHRMRHRFVTPQFIVNGQFLQAGNGPEVAEVIAKLRRPQAEGEVRFEQPAPHRLRFAPANGPLAGDFNLLYAEIQPGAKTDILAGENAGKTITYVNIVQKLEPMGRWNGQGPGELVLPQTAATQAVILQETPLGRIIAAYVLK